MNTIKNAIGSIAVLCAALAVLGWATKSCQEATAETVATAGDSTAKVIDSAAQALSGVFGAKVSISNRGVVAVPQEIVELAVLAHDTTVTSRLDKARVFGWFPSTLVLSGSYRGKLGIDVAQVKGRLDPVARVLELELPPSEILSVELLHLERVYEDQSWFTPISTEEVIELGRQNGRQGYEGLDQGELLRAADRRLRERLCTALSGTGVALRLAEPAG